MNIENVAVSYNQLADRYEPSIPRVFERVSELSRLRQQIVGAQGDLRGAPVLDIGCGGFPFSGRKLTDGDELAKGGRAHG